MRDDDIHKICQSKRRTDRKVLYVFTLSVIASFCQKNPLRFANHELPNSHNKNLLSCNSTGNEDLCHISLFFIENILAFLNSHLTKNETIATVKNLVIFHSLVA